MQGRSWNAVRSLFILGLALALPLASACFAASKAPLSSTAKAGKKVFADNCALCHNTNSTQAKIGPGLKGLFKHKELPYSHRPTTVANVREQIDKGNANAKPMPMPPFGSKLTATQINDVIAYLKTL